MEKKKIVNNDTIFTKTSIFIIQLLTLIYEKDQISNKNNEIAFLKTTLLDKFNNLLYKKYLCPFFINNSILDLLRKWIEPLPDGSIPNNILTIKVLKLIKFFSNFNRNNSFYDNNKIKIDSILIQNEVKILFREIKDILELNNINEDNLYSEIQVKSENFPSQEVRVNTDVLEKSKVGHIVRFYKDFGKDEVKRVSNEIFQLFLEIISNN